MTPSQVTEIEAEARACVEAYPGREHYNLRGARYLVAMLAVIDGLRAEIDQVRAIRDNGERRLHAACDTIDQLHAEIAALKATRDALGEYRDTPELTP